MKTTHLVVEGGLDGPLRASPGIEGAGTAGARTEVE
jgi:hypothetical protein